MTLERFLTGLADRRWTWPGLRRLRPPADQPFNLRACLAVVAVTAALALLAGLGLKGLLMHSPLGGSWWPLRWGFWIGLLFGGYYAVLARLAWNRRAARLRTAGQAQPEKPRLRWWQWLFLAPVYAAVVLVATPVALLYAADGALGEWAWRRYHAGLVARGEPATFEQLVGPMPPDAENFAMAPLLRPALAYRQTPSLTYDDPAGVARLEAIGLPFRNLPAKDSAAVFLRHGLVPPDTKTNVLDPATGKIRAGRLRDSRMDLLPYAYGLRTVTNVAPTNLPPELVRRYGLAPHGVRAPEKAEFSEAFFNDPAGDVLAGLARFGPEMDELAEASRRPRSLFPHHYDEGFMLLLPHLAQFKKFSTMFAARSAARLAKGDMDGAFADVQTGLRLAEAMREDPFLISYLVRVAQASIATRAAWQGLVEHRWTEPQLAALQGAFAGTEFRTNLVRAMQGERLGANATFDLMLRQRDTTRRAMDGMGPVDDLPPPGAWLGATFVPRGLLRRNQVSINRAHGQLIADLRAPGWPQGVAGRNFDDLDPLFRAAGLERATPHNIMARMLLPAVNKAEAKSARATVVARLAVTACALERHRLRTGAYPAALAELVPALLPDVPRDPLDGQPLRYRRRDDGHFDLWSVGLNGRDDGGVMLEDVDRTGDWVWPPPYPTPGLRLF